MSEFVELEEWWGIRRSKIIGYRVLPASGHCKPSMVVWAEGTSGEFQVEFDTLEQAQAAAQTIGGVSQAEAPQWKDSRIIKPALAIDFRTQESPILWGKWLDGSEYPFRVKRTGEGELCVDLTIPAALKRRSTCVRMPEFWRHLPVAEKIEILDRIHKETIGVPIGMKESLPTPVTQPPSTPCPTCSSTPVGAEQSLPLLPDC